MAETAQRWPTKAKIERAIQLHVDMGFKYGGYECGPGFVRVFTPAQVKKRDPVEQWLEEDLAS